MSNHQSDRTNGFEQRTVAVRTRWKVAFPVVGALLGLLASFIVGPIVAWLLNRIGDAPGPLRLAAELPFAWAVPVLTIIGVIAGFFLLVQWDEDAGKIVVDRDAVTIVHKQEKRRLSRGRVDGVFTDGTDLVILGEHGSELLRRKIDEEIGRPARSRARALRLSLSGRHGSPGGAVP